MATAKSLDRRYVTRIDLRAPSVITAEGGEGEKVMELYSKDISARGAFFPTETPLPIGTRVGIAVSLSIAGVKSLLGYPGRVRITTSGVVTRSSPDGMAIAFDRKYRMEQIAS